ncbi:MAG: hypothetical protein SFY32_09785 [Bacteroidota bacterium]|nr:hypothetical protein [Bacteroidota bacterium]
MHTSKIQQFLKIGFYTFTTLICVITIICISKRDKYINYGVDFSNGYNNGLIKLSNKYDNLYQLEFGIFDSTKYLKHLNYNFNADYSHNFILYSFYDNYVLFLFSELTQSKHRGIVIAEHLAMESEGICSQKTILFNELLRLKNFKTRVVRLNKHFCSEVFINGKWVFMDVGKKLQLIKMDTLYSAEEIKNSKKIFNEYYLKNIKNDHTDSTITYHFFDKVEYAEINSFPAQNLRQLHYFTFFISDFLWLICIIISIYFYRKERTFTPHLSYSHSNETF